MSNTALLYEKGFRGINIEPNPEFYRKFTECRPEDINLNCGIGTEAGIMDYYSFDFPFLNTFSKEDTESVKGYGYEVKEICQVPVIPLQQILEEYCGNQFPDLLNIDTEGLDLEILQQIDYAKSAPKIIIAETVIFGSIRKDLRIRNYLESVGYEAPYETPINTVFVRGDCWKQMF